jgi:hypothetical protein
MIIITGWHLAIALDLVLLHEAQAEASVNFKTILSSHNEGKRRNQVQSPQPSSSVQPLPQRP